jgi:hypothetical protein
MPLPTNADAGGAGAGGRSASQETLSTLTSDS